MYDIVFISYQEPNAEKNFKKIKERFPLVKRVHGVKGIHQAHIAAAKKCMTNMFWIVDGDAVILDEFNFDHVVPDHQLDHVHVWRAKNSVNGLVYGYGGVKLFPRILTINMDTSKPDMTTSISGKFKAMPETSNLTVFNTDPFNAWKSAFRECVKLSSKVIDRQKDKETDRRLKIWETKGIRSDFGEYCIRGAIEGTEYGKTHKNSPNDLRLINDFDWLQDRFNGTI